MSRYGFAIHLTRQPCILTESSIFEIKYKSLEVQCSNNCIIQFSDWYEVKMADGAAGEDRVQDVCSQKNGWLICGIYDRFNE
ncbi:hypothetical protein ACQJBY_066404 [Aegilops geniculata]